MRDIHTEIYSDKEARAFILAAEDEFYSNLKREVTALVNQHIVGSDVRMLSLSGPTCAGKTTTANQLIRQIEVAGYHPVILSIDDFFLERERTNDVSTERPDYDSVKAIDLQTFADCVNDLRRGKTTMIPHYDFKTGKRDSYTEYSPTARDIYVFEGIQAVYPEVVGTLDPNYKSIFIDVAEDVCYRGVTFLRHEIRLLRRIVRDYQFRNAYPEFTLFMWENVRENEITNIYPNAKTCDIVIDSFLSYELFIIAQYAFLLLASVPDTSDYRAEAIELCEKLMPLLNPYFSESMIPKDSFFREFIGTRSVL